MSSSRVTLARSKFPSVSSGPFPTMPLSRITLAAYAARCGE
jgi:hypothetical protein